MADEEHGMGHNSNAGSYQTEDRRALFHTHLNPIWELEKRLDDLKAEKTKLKRQAKAEGFMSYEIDEAIRFRKTEKPETMNDRVDRIVAVAWYLNEPVGHQFNIFQARPEEENDAAFQAGLQAGLQAEPHKNPDGNPRWDEGYAEGQRRLKEAMRKRMDAENARKAEEAEKAKQAKRGPGRPKGSKNKVKDGAASGDDEEPGKPFRQQLSEQIAKGETVGADEPAAA